MSIVRVSKRERFVIIDKTGVEDGTISFRATGLLTYLLSKPNDWTINYRALSKVKTEGEHAVLTALGELEAAGYLKRERKRGSGGRIEWEQVLYECPTCDQDDATMPQESPHGAASGDADRAADIRDGVSPAGKTAALTEEGPSKNETEEEPNPSSPPTEDDFQTFWSLYPRRNGKRDYRAKAEQAWRKLKPEERAAAMAGVRNYGAACDAEIRIAKDAFRWLRDRGYEDWQTPADLTPRRNGARPGSINPNDSWSDEERGIA